MLTSRDRILTTHVGSLPRNETITELLIRREAGETIDPKRMSDELDRAVADVVKRQRQAGVDIGNDGEQQRVAFQTYMAARMTGYGGESKRRVGKDFVEHPDLVAPFGRRFIRRARISNAPQAIAAVRYTDTGPITSGAAGNGLLMDFATPVQASTSRSLTFRRVRPSSTVTFSETSASLARSPAEAAGPVERSSW